MAGRKPSNYGVEFDHHIVAIRMRVVGSGNLNIGLESLDLIKSSTLVPIVMSATTNIEPTRLANFQSQRVRYTLNIQNINEYFVINRIILFAKPVATEFPM